MDSDEETKDEIQAILKEFDDYQILPGPILQKILRFKAALLNEIDGSELDLILYLVESHIPGLRLKAEIQIDINEFQRKTENSILNREHLCFPNSHMLSLGQADIDVMLERIAEMPKEWTIIQITPQFSNEEIFATDSKHISTKGIYVTVFNCGRRSEVPYCVNLPNDVLTTREDMRMLKNNLKEALSLPQREGMNEQQQTNTLSYKQRKLYHKKKAHMEETLEAIVRDLEDYWLGVWRCLLIGKYKNELIDQEIRSLVKKFLAEKSRENVSEKVMNILVQAVKGMPGNEYNMEKYLPIILDYCFPGENLCNAWKLFWRKHKILTGKEERHPVILIVDETLDALPWEMINTLSNQPTSRMPSLHLLYAIYKAHEDSIIDGYKVISNYQNGRFILNPGLDLGQMEERLKTFFEYWLPEWTGIAGKTPNSAEFRDLVTSANIFSYSGHGSGAQYCPSDKIQKKKIDSVVLLFGCGSTQLVEQGPEVEMYGTSQMYLLAACPCLIGMLWVVTDVETDLLTTRLLSSWIPNSKKAHWQCVDQIEWAQSGKVIIKENEYPEAILEPDLLKALCIAKNGIKYLCNKAAVVARGIPVKLVNPIS
ncbi:hypothetical protein HHI36_000365 [Cryptolaemus montrouzieri]|uniref:separase n=1 Tax=Cryptolaemus montrouzieri TaxID=559131 RepID=A0ABD2P5I1_9CUCU